MYFDSDSEYNNAIIQEFLDASYQEFLTENDDVSNDLIDEISEDEELYQCIDDETVEQMTSKFDDYQEFNPKTMVMYSDEFGVDFDTEQEYWENVVSCDDEMIEVDIMNDATEEQLESCFSIPTLDLKTYYEDWESWFEKFNAQYMDKLEKTCSVCM